MTESVEEVKRQFLCAADDVEVLVREIKRQAGIVFDGIEAAEACVDAGAKVQIDGLSHNWEANVISGVKDFDATATKLAVYLVARFEGFSYLHIKALTEKAVSLIGARTLVSRATVVIPEATSEHRPASSG